MEATADLSDASAAASPGKVAVGVDEAARRSASTRRHSSASRRRRANSAIVASTEERTAAQANRGGKKGGVEIGAKVVGVGLLRGGSGISAL
jgi:hypothetical protein